MHVFKLSLYICSDNGRLFSDYENHASEKLSEGILASRKKICSSKEMYFISLKPDNKYQRLPTFTHYIIIIVQLLI
jgi:hypothetical protein